jgi:hypothetical protein
VALVYVLHQPPHVLALVGTRSEGAIAEALARRPPTDEQLAWLEQG